MTTQGDPLKIGEMARRAGVSVRTLHYYEEIGLLESERSRSGHRLYGRPAIERLQQIRSLQQLGRRLSEIDALLRGRDISPERIVADHLAEIRSQREALTHLETQLTHLQSLLRREPEDETEAINVFLKTLEALHQNVMELLHDEPEARREHGLDDALFSYLGKALAPDEHPGK